jgi:anti-anti-sigma factor
MSERVDGSDLRCVVERDAPVSLVRLVGRLDLTTAPAVRTALLKSLTSQPEVIVVDVSGVQVADELALSVFTAVSRHAAGWPGTTLVLAAAAPELAAALERMAMRRYVPTFPTVEEAMAVDRESTPPMRLDGWFEPTSASLASARTLVDRVCHAWGVGEVSGVAQLIVTELVANAVRHAATEMELSVMLRPRHLHLAVHDRSHALAKRLGAPHELAGAGRGLLVVEAMSAGWGCTPTEDGKRVWAMLRVRPFESGRTG